MSDHFGWAGRATFVLAMPPAWLRANVPNVHGDRGVQKVTKVTP
jgi:hypothetical protein